VVFTFAFIHWFAHSGIAADKGYE
jgi:hypothetical protein